MAIGAGQPGHAWSESSIKANAPQSSGVYAIYSAVWIYIGESNDIQRKLLEHWSGDNACITRAIPTAFAFEVCNLTERVRRQAALIVRFGPLCNQLTAKASPSQK
jgi:excinuclease UvrABC nuclease subunit